MSSEEDHDEELEIQEPPETNISALVKYIAQRKAKEGYLNNVYGDAWAYICTFLDPWDIVNLSRVCRNMYRAVNKPQIRRMVCYPFKEKFKLTPEQFATLKRLLNSDAQCKLIVGDVGSGKTWLAIAYLMHRYRDALQGGAIKAVITVPPANVAQWAEFLTTYTNLHVVSNYRACSLSVEPFIEVPEDQTDDERMLGIVPEMVKKPNPELTGAPIYLTSLINAAKLPLQLSSGEPSDFVIIHDETHNKTSLATNNDHCIEHVGFTASLKTFNARKEDDNDWKVFKLRSMMLREHLPPVIYETYGFTGFPESQKSVIASILGSKKTGRMSADSINSFLDEVTFGRAPSYGLQTKIGRKNVSVVNKWLHQEILSGPQMVEVLNEVPKLRAMLALCARIKERGEKLVIFDINTNYLSFLYIYLRHYGIEAYVVSQLYSASQRPKQIEKFQQSGDVLLGSISMLSEGHNITEANHVYFVRHPRNPDQYKQAIGRVHRFPQNKRVYVHLLASCELELFLALKGMEKAYARVLRSSITEILEDARSQCKSSEKQKRTVQTESLILVP